MKKTIFAGLIFILILVFLSGCINNDVMPNGKTIYNHVFMAVDETNMKEVVGSVDYVFIGTVTGINQRVISNDYPQEYYAVRVEENLKGELWTDSDIEVSKQEAIQKTGQRFFMSPILLSELGCVLSVKNMFLSDLVSRTEVFFLIICTAYGIYG